MLLARFGPSAAVTGRRSVDQYRAVLTRFGAHDRVTPDGVLSFVSDRFTGCEIDLREFMADLVLLSGPLVFWRQPKVR
ncbi:hypothetical protein [Mycobacterium lepromatosis]|uniref:hypothetical protein n=1 Tax=Mycobacterium lepromatosis TaxID=480418 RepID=UPI0015853508|nr:hypothetical protein [Mycobacterium lepromatosis]